MNEAEEIHTINKKLDTLTNTVNSLALSLGKSMTTQENEKELRNSLTDQVKALSKTLTLVNNNLSEMNGIRKGVTGTMKVVWVLLGSLITATIIGGAIMIIGLNTRVSVLENQIKTIEKKLK